MAEANKEQNLSATVPPNIGTAPETPGTPPKPPKKKKKPLKKRIRNIIIAVIGIVILALIARGCVAFFTGGSEGAGEVLTAFVDMGSITSTVSGEGLTRAKESASMTLMTSGTVQDIYVKEGDRVEAGQQLYMIKSQAAEDAVTDARKQVEDYNKELKKAQQSQADLTVRAPHGGKLLDVQTIKNGDDVSAGTTIATVVDDSTLKLTQYYSYAYAGEIKVGQAADISIPSVMTTVRGKVSEIHMVERISTEGSKLFEVDLTLTNPGSLTADMDASAALSIDGETIYPYEAGKLEYAQSTAVVTKVGGSAQSVDLRNYAAVKAGDVLLSLSGDESESVIFNLNNQLKEAQKTLEEAEKALALLNGRSPIAGTVVSITMETGDEVASGTTVMVVADSSTILLDANVDERNISYVKTGMTVDIDQWDTKTVGEITSVSLTSTTENGVARFPAVISIDNSDGTIMAGSYANYTMIASQSENCMVIPVQCVKSVETENGVQSVVFVRTDERPENAIDPDVPVDDVPEFGYYAVPVVTGISNEQNVEIISGLEVGMEVFQQIMYYGYMW